MGRVLYSVTTPGETIPEHYFEPGMVVRCTDKKSRIVAKVHFDYGYKRHPHWVYYGNNGSALRVNSEYEYRWSSQENKRPRFKKGQRFNFAVSSARIVSGNVLCQTSLDDMANVYLINDERTELYDIKKSVLEKIAEGQEPRPSEPLQMVS